MSKSKSFSDYGIDVPAGASGEVKTTCPQCSPQRRKSSQPCLSVNADEGVWHCWHCEWAGTLKGGADRDESRDIPAKKRVVRKPVYAANTTLPAKVLGWFQARGIGSDVLAANRVGYGPVWMPAVQGESMAIQFPYLKGEAVVNIKYRDGQKNFRQAKDAEKCLYRHDDIAAGNGTLIVCEGEMDALSLCQCGYTNATSVPDGAPSPNTKNYQTKFDWLESAEEVFARYDRVILCVDNDAPGQTLERELGRRIGLEKCWRVIYPDGCKDINDVLVKHDQQAVSAVIGGAHPFPIEGCKSCGDIAEDVLRLFDCGLQRGVTTGWASVDKHYTVKTGQWTVVTGIPGSGKSNWLDALMANLYMHHDWSFAICSPENWPVERHMAALAEKISGLSFDRNARTCQHMDRQYLADLLAYVRNHFHFILPSDDDMSIDGVLEKARALIYRYGVRGIVLDPWNEFDHKRRDGQSETDYISLALSKVRRFSRMHDCHVWLVAHPQKLQKKKDLEEYPVPTPYDISGSAHWRNKADNAICVHRPDPDNDVTEVYIQKIRFREVGSLGLAELRYCRDNGTYHDKP